MDRDIAVVGMACVFPRAENVDQFWSNNVNGVDAITEIPRGRWPNVDFTRLPLDHDTRIACTRGGFLPTNVTIDPRRYGLMPNLLRNTDPDQFVMTAIVHQALSDAGVGEDDPVRRRTDVIAGRGGYISVKMAETFLRVDLVSRVIPFLRQQFPELGRQKAGELEAMLHATLPPHEPESYITCIPNLVASRVCNRLNLRGSAFVVDGACASSLIAVEQAVERLRNRRCDLAVAAGIHLCQNPSFWFVFTHLGALSASGNSRPFDARADGLLLGEGAGAVALKRLEDAYRDGDRIHAIIKGAASASDGRDAGVLTPSPNGQVEALRRAYQDAAVDPQSITLLEAHGTATLAGDVAEIESIKRFYGSQPYRTRVLSSVKSMIGHAMPAAGMASLIRAVLALSNKILPPTINCEQPREELKETAFYVLDEARPWIHPQGQEPRRAGVNAFGFGGINAHVVLEESPHSHPARPAASCSRPFRDARRHAAELVLFSAATEEELVESLRQLLVFLDRNESSPELADVAFSRLNLVDFDHRVKLALVCRDLDELRELATECMGKIQAGEQFARDDHRLHYAVDAAKPRGAVAVMFPGMAFPGLVGNFPKHLLEVCLHFPELRAALDRFENKDGRADDPLPFSYILSPPGSFDAATRKLLEDRVAPPKAVDDAATAAAITPAERNLAGVGMTLSNWMGWRLLQGLGVRPDMVCGQSAGDLVSMAAAGVLDYERDIVPQLWEGMNVPPNYLACGCMAFIAAGQERVQACLDAQPNTHVAIDISPDAVLIGGPFDEIEQICKQLREQEIMAIGLPYLPGHTPLLSYLRGELVYAVDDSKILGPPQIRAYSALTSDLFPTDPQGIRESLMANLDHPVRFWQTNRRMHEDGARVFIQAGCGTLAANVESVLEDPQVVSVAVDVENREPVTQLCVMVGMLFAAGVRFDPTWLFKHRQPVALDFQAPQRASAEKGGMRFPLDWRFYSPEKDPTEDWPSTNEATQCDVQDATCESEPSRAPFQSIEHASRQPAQDEQDASPPPTRTESAESVAPMAQPAGEAPAPPPASGLPFMTNIVHYVPQEAMVAEHTLRLNDDLYLRDHHFVNAASVKPVSDCLPVLPAVMMMEAMAEAAACLAPGLAVVGLEDFRALRWVNLADNPEPTIRIEARLAAIDQQTGVHYVQAEILNDGQPCAAATVLFAAERQQELQMVFPELLNAGPWPISAVQLYRDKHTFHGPRFQTVSSLDLLGDNGLLGELIVLPKHDLFASQPDLQLLLDPAVIDGAGQLLGSWSQTRGAYMLPIGIDKLELYRPSPPPGARVPIRLEITRFDLDANVATCDFEIQDGEGGVWMRVRGWRDRVFVKQSEFMEVHRAPERRCLSKLRNAAGLPANSVCMEIREDDLSSGSLAWIAALHLTSDELAGLRTMIGKRRSQFLLGRIAVKDAVRQWLAQQRGDKDMLHPAAISIGHTASGQPFVAPIAGFDRLPNISLSHTDGCTVGIAADEPVGIDVEPITRPNEEILEHFADPCEIQLIRELAADQPDEAWETRLWCAKESASKAVGTGLGGHMSDFRVVSIETDGCFRILHRPSSGELVAATTRDETIILAVCGSDREAMTDPMALNVRH